MSEFRSARGRDIDRFWSKVAKAGPDECWEWIGSRNSTGYGTFRFGPSPHRAHRWLMEQMLGRRLGRQELVLHSCQIGDNPSCCNPAHLRVGTHSENMEDRHERGRQARGTRNGSSSFLPGDIRFIRAVYAGGCRTQKQLAQAYGCSHQAISFIVRRSTWAHLR